MCPKGRREGYEENTPSNQKIRQHKVKLIFSGTGTVMGRRTQKALWLQRVNYDGT